MADQLTLHSRWPAFDSIYLPDIENRCGRNGAMLRRLPAPLLDRARRVGPFATRGWRPSHYRSLGPTWRCQSFSTGSNYPLLKASAKFTQLPCHGLTTSSQPYAILLRPAGKSVRGSFLTVVLQVQAPPSICLAPSFRQRCLQNKASRQSDQDVGCSNWQADL
jgi:hypothetical protein